jgi:hypothetical protein
VAGAVQYFFLPLTCCSDGAVTTRRMQMGAARAPRAPALDIPRGHAHTRPSNAPRQQRDDDDDDGARARWLELRRRRRQRQRQRPRYTLPCLAHSSNSGWPRTFRAHWHPHDDASTHIQRRRGGPGLVARRPASPRRWRVLPKNKRSSLPTREGKDRRRIDGDKKDTKAGAPASAGPPSTTTTRPLAACRVLLFRNEEARHGNRHPPSPVEATIGVVQRRA